MGKEMYFNIETQTKNKNRQTQIKNLLEQIQKTWATWKLLKKTRVNLGPLEG
jgi:hypothetical protein